MFFDLIAKIFVPLKSSVPVLLLVYMYQILETDRTWIYINPLMRVMSFTDVQPNQFASNYRSIWSLVYEKHCFLKY